MRFQAALPQGNKKDHKTKWERKKSDGWKSKLCACGHTVEDHRTWVGRGGSLASCQVPGCGCEKYQTKNEFSLPGTTS